MFRLAHLSDPHLGPLPDPRIAELASKRVLGYLNWRLNRGRGAMRPAVLDELVADIHAAKPDHICVTGDIVNLALDAELAPARAWLDQIGSGADVSVVPGNHDAYVRGALRRASDAWSPFLVGDGAEHVRFPYVRRRGPLAIVGVSSAHATGPFMATGKVEAGQALLLADALEHLGREGLFRVVLIHHPPTRRAIHWAARLIDAGRFRNVVREVGAELVLHGHTHRASVDWLEAPGDSIVPVVGVPSASRSPRPDRRGAGWNMFEISGEAGRWTIEQIERGFVAPGRGAEEVSRRQLVAESVRVA